jgi:cell cycle sensor histidine kinase DivJ
VQVRHEGIDDGAASRALGSAWGAMRAKGDVSYFILTRLIVGVGGLAALPPLVVTSGLDRTVWLLIILGLSAQIGAAVLAGFSKLRFEFAYVLSLAGLASAVTSFSGPTGLFALTPCMIEAGLLLDRRMAFGTGIVLSCLFAVAVVFGDSVTAVYPLGFPAFMSAFVVVMIGTGFAIEAVLSRLDARDRAFRTLQSSNMALIDAVDRGVALVDDKGHLHAPTAALIEMTGRPAHELVGERFFEQLHVLSRPAYLKAVSDALHADVVVKTQIKLKCRIEGDGDLYRDFDLVVRVANPEAAETARCAVVSLGETVLAERAAPSARDPLFEAQLRHELKTPLNAILGFAEILANPALVPDDDPRRHDYIRIIATSARHLVDLLDHMKSAPAADIPDLTEAEAVEIETLISEALAMLSLSAEESRVVIDRQIEEGLPALFGERHELRQIIINLVSNAVKFSPEGRVVIAASRHPGGVGISVSDDGVGMADRELMRVGEPYFRGSAGESGMAEGEGLGLAVVRRLVERHDGSLTLESAPGNGTTAYLVFPHVRADAISPTPGFVETLHTLDAIEAGQSPLPVDLLAADIWRRKSA